MAVRGDPSQPQTRFIGREKELAALHAAALRVKNGEKGELLLLSGGAGLGKTRLCREFGKRCLTEGMGFTRSACQPHANAFPLWPIRRLLREKLGIKAGMPGEEMRRLVEAALTALNSPPAAAVQPLWLEFLEAAEDTQRAAAQALGMQGRLLDIVAAALLHSNSGQLLLIEDLEWADPASLEFLQRLARELDGSRTLLLLNHGPDFAPASAQVFHGMAVASLHLGAFAGRELQQLTADWLGVHRSVRDVARHVQEHTRGNPFFLEQAVRDLEQTGYLRGVRGAYELARPMGEWHVPDTVQALLAARMERLPAEQKNLLQTAAVVGQKFTLPLLAELTGAALYDVVDRARALEAAGFLRRPGAIATGEFVLSHALLQGAAYHSLLEARRKTLHARLADWLERLHPQTASPCEQWLGIAGHWEKSGQWARAGAWNLAAVQWAARWDLKLMLEQVRAALANLDRGGALLETVEKRIAARATLIRMSVHTAVPGHEVERAYLEGREMAKSSRDAESQAQLLLSYGLHCLHRGDADFAAERAEQAARLVPPARNTGAAAAGREADESFTDYVLHIHNAAGRLEEGLALARELAGRDWATAPMTARNYLARAEHAAALTYRGHLEQARAELQTVLGFAAHDDNTISWVHAFLVDHAVLSGDTSQVLEHARGAKQRADAIGGALHQALALRALGAAHCLTGQHAQAVALLEQAHALFAEGTSGYIFQGVYLATLAEGYRGSGHPKQAAEAADSAIAAARRACTRIQELQAWTVFLSLPRNGPWVSRVPLGLTRMEELIAFTGASAFLPWWCQSQARWAPDSKARRHWQRQTVDAFTRMGATPHVKRLGQTG